MKRALLCLAAVAGFSSGIAWSADSPTSRLAGRQIIAERNFDDVSFVIGAGAAMKWLEIYVGDNLVAAYRDFDAEDVIASPDRKYFLALSSNSKSSYAFAIFDRQGRIKASRPHGGDLHYCNRTAWGIGEWADTKKPQATFSIQKNQMTTPATEYLQATVRGCDGKTVILARAPPPSLKATAVPPATLATPTVANEVVVTGTRIAVPRDNASTTSAIFIGSTIQNLRGLDPTFGANTLTLVDGPRANPRAAANYTTKAIAMPATWTAAPLSLRTYNCGTGAGDCGADLLVSRPDGSTQTIATDVVGDFIPLPGARRIFSCGYTNRTTYHAPSSPDMTPAVVDLDGNRTSLPSHPGPLRICARTGTGDQVLLVYTMASVGKRFNLARVFDANGAMLAEGNYEKEGTLQFTVADKPYAESVPGP